MRVYTRYLWITCLSAWSGHLKDKSTRLSLRNLSRLSVWSSSFIRCIGIIGIPNSPDSSKKQVYRPRLLDWILQIRRRLRQATCIWRGRWKSAWGFSLQGMSLQPQICMESWLSWSTSIRITYRRRQSRVTRWWRNACWKTATKYSNCST